MMTLNRGPNPRNEAIRALLVRSGNHCAFPGCEHPILNDGNEFIAQVCHIEGAAPGGPRYNPAMSDEQRRSYANLLILCYRHHVETNDAVVYTVSALREMKRLNEERFADAPLTVSEEVVASVAQETTEYWQQVDHANRHEHIVPELKVPIDVTATTPALIERLRASIVRLGNLHAALSASADALPKDIEAALAQCGYDLAAWSELPYWENPAINRDWELRALGLENTLTAVYALLDQLELRALDAEVTKEPGNDLLRERLTVLREQFLHAAKAGGYVD